MLLYSAVFDTEHDLAGVTPSQLFCDVTQTHWHDILLKLTKQV